MKPEGPLPPSDDRPATGSGSESDGRRLRSQRSRERILDAVAKALVEPALELTAEQIAASAGVSISTLFRHFGDMEGLSRAMRARVAARAMPEFARGPFTGTTRERVAELLDRRTSVFEIIAPFWRVMLRQPRPTPAVFEEVRTFEEALTLQLREALSDEFAASGDPREPALRALLSFGSWDHLRSVQALDPDAVRRVLEAAVHRLLAERT